MDDGVRRYYFTRVKSGTEMDGMFPKIRRYFYSVYNNEEFLVDALNKKITHQMFRISTDDQKSIDETCVMLMNNMFSKSNSF